MTTLMREEMEKRANQKIYLVQRERLKIEDMRDGQYIGDTDNKKEEKGNQEKMVV